jgi:hypothetical protein
MNITKERSHDILTVVSNHFLAHIWYEVMVFEGHGTVYEHYHGTLLTAILGVRKRSCDGESMESVEWGVRSFE